MATIDELIALGVIVRVEVELDGAQPFRRLLALPGTFQPFLDVELGKLVTQVGADLTPTEQVYALFRDYAVGEEMNIGRQFHQLRPGEDGVWELKTEDVRIFGWFVAPDTFIAVYGDDATKIKKHDLYHGHVKQVVRERDKLDLDEPKFFKGGAKDVITNKN